MITEINSVVVGTAHIPNRDGKDGHTYDAWYSVARQSEFHPVLGPHILLRRVDLGQITPVSNALMSHPVIDAAFGELGVLQYDTVMRQLAEMQIGTGDLSFHDVFNIIYFNHDQSRRLAACGLSFATMDAHGYIVRSEEFVVPDVGTDQVGMIHGSYDDGEKIWHAVDIGGSLVMAL